MGAVEVIETGAIELSFNSQSSNFCPAHVATLTNDPSASLGQKDTIHTSYTSYVTNPSKTFPRG